MLTENQYDREAADSKRAWKPVLWIIAAMSLMVLPQSRYQDDLKMAIWSVIFAGLVVTYTWPFIVDILSTAVVALMVILHFPVMFIVYPRIPHHGYLLIGMAIAVEYAACLIPIAWLDLRSQRSRGIKE